MDKKYIDIPVVDRDKVIATMASYGNRVNTLKDSINSIINQVDEIWVYLNEYNSIPTFLNNDKIKIYRSQNELGDLKAKGKFFKCEEINGYHFTIDDDLIYPEDYVDKYISYFKKYNNNLYLTSHGKMLKKPLKDYYLDYGISFHFKNEVKNETYIHIPGTGVGAYHTSKFKINFEEILDGSYVDLFISLQLQDCNLPVLLVPHKHMWVKQNSNSSQTDNLFYKNRITNKKPTQIMKSHNWILNTIN